MLDPGKGEVKRGYFWALARDDRRRTEGALPAQWNGDDPPGVAFTYAPGRSGKHAVDILKGFDGILQVDGYTGYNRVIDPKRQANIRLAYCWAHARRKLFELTKNSAAPIAQEGLRQITALYRVEAQIRSLPASQRLAVRQDNSAPMVASLKTWLEQARAQVSAKSPTGEALKYIAKYWDGLILFLTDGRIEMDNNTPSHCCKQQLPGSGANAPSAPLPSVAKTVFSQVTKPGPKTGQFWPPSARPAS